jgi:V/A-type H+/Na+-transporting ATPase subunit D
MAISLNKTSLKEQRDHLEMYQRFLPSLDLKRQQLIADYQHARRIVADTERELEETVTAQSGLLELLGASGQDLSGLVAVESVSVVDENILGARLPVLKDVAFRTTDYSMLAKPFWVDFLVELLKSACRLTIRRDIERERVRRLGEAVRRITQRVNLFEKVLIPEAEQNIQRIRIYLADAERAAVVRSKIAKAKQHREHSIREVL